MLGNAAKIEGFFIKTFFNLRYAEGDLPLIDLNCLLKFDILLNPLNSNIWDVFYFIFN
jgi:hypothetical protein